MRRVDHVLRAEDVGLDGLERVVLGGRHLLERGRVDDDVDAVEGAVQALAIAHVAEEVAQALVALGRNSAASRTA